VKVINIMKDKFTPLNPKSITKLFLQVLHTKAMYIKQANYSRIYKED
jgi:hypothetical protein